MYAKDRKLLLIVIISIILSYVMGYGISVQLFKWVDIRFEAMFTGYLTMAVSPFILYLFIRKIDGLYGLQLDNYKLLISERMIIIHPYLQIEVESLKNLVMDDSYIKIYTNNIIQIPLESNKYYSAIELSKLSKILKAKIPELSVYNNLTDLYKYPSCQLI